MASSFGESEHCLSSSLLASSAPRSRCLQQECTPNHAALYSRQSSSNNSAIEMDPPTSLWPWSQNRFPRSVSDRFRGVHRVENYLDTHTRGGQGTGHDTFQCHAAPIAWRAWILWYDSTQCHNGGRYNWLGHCLGSQLNLHVFLKYLFLGPSGMKRGSRRQRRVESTPWWWWPLACHRPSSHNQIHIHETCHHGRRYVPGEVGDILDLVMSMSIGWILAGGLLEQVLLSTTSC